MNAAAYLIKRALYLKRAGFPNTVTKALSAGKDALKEGISGTSSVSTLPGGDVISPVGDTAYAAELAGAGRKALKEGFGAAVKGLASPTSQIAGTAGKVLGGLGTAGAIGAGLQTIGGVTEAAFDPKLRQQILQDAATKPLAGQMAKVLDPRQAGQSLATIVSPESPMWNSQTYKGMKGWVTSNKPVTPKNMPEFMAQNSGLNPKAVQAYRSRTGSLPGQKPSIETPPSFYEKPIASDTAALDKPEMSSNWGS